MGRKERDSTPSRLRAARHGHGVSLTQFAGQVGYSRSYLSAVELGHLPETEQIVLAYEAALGLGKGSLTEGKQSVARVLDRFGNFAPGSHAKVGASPVRFPAGRILSTTRHDAIDGMTTLLLDAAAAAPPDEVLVSSFSDLSDGRLPSPQMQAWSAAQQALLSQGWSITHLIRLTDDVSRSLSLVESMFNLLASSPVYEPFYSDGSQPLPPAQDVLIVPGAGALLRFDLQSTSTQSVLFVREPAAIEALRENFRLLKHSSQPLIEHISRDDVLVFQSLVTQIESFPGERVLVQSGLLSRGPQSVSREDGWLPSAVDAVETFDDGLTALRKQRQQSFFANLQRYRHRDIALQRSVKETVRMSLMMRSGLVLTEGEEKFHPANIIAQIDGAIDALRAFPNYELALLDDSETSLIQAEHGESVVFWLVKGGKELLLESWPRDETGESRHLHLAIHDPSIATAFQEHFKNIWGRIAPRNRDRANVIAWLKEQRNLLTGV